MQLSTGSVQELSIEVCKKNNEQNTSCLRYRLAIWVGLGSSNKFISVKQIRKNQHLD